MELTEANVIEVLSELAPYIEADGGFLEFVEIEHCLLYTSPSPRDVEESRMPSSA